MEVPSPPRTCLSVVSKLITFHEAAGTEEEEEEEEEEEDRVYMYIYSELHFSWGAQAPVETQKGLASPR